MIKDELITNLEQRWGGKLSYFYHDLQAGVSADYRGDTKISTASTIKLPILIHVALEVEGGSHAWDEPLTLTDEDKVRGSGILFGLSAGLTLSLRDTCYLMTVLSDNTATNMIIDRFGLEAINARIRQLGLEHTTLFRKAFTPDTAESREFGLGVTTPREMGHLLIKLAHKEIGREETTAAILDMLAAQQDRAAIPRYLPADWKYAGKTGRIEHLRGDVGIVTAPDGRQFVLALFCSEIPTIDWTVDNPGLQALAQLARSLLLPLD